MSRQLFACSGSARPRLDGRADEPTVMGETGKGDPTMATATLGYRTYIDEREAGSDFYPHHEIDVWLTGEVIDGPNVEYDNSDKADDWYRDRMDSFTLRVRGARFPDHGDLDVLIHAHNNSE